MNHYDVIQRYKNLRSKKENVYVTVAANDYFDKSKVCSNDIYLEDELVDESQDTLILIEQYIDSIIREDYVRNTNFEELYVKFIPLLFYRLDTIKEEYLIDNEYLDYNTCYVKLMISFVTVKNGKNKYIKEENPIIKVVDYNKFVSMLELRGYCINYRNFHELYRDIFKCAKEERFPDLFITVFDKEETKKYQEEVKNEYKKSL